MSEEHPENGRERPEEAGEEQSPAGEEQRRPEGEDDRSGLTDELDRAIEALGRRGARQAGSGEPGPSEPGAAGPGQKAPRGQDTVEADTLALADREEERERAAAAGVEEAGSAVGPGAADPAHAPPAPGGPAYGGDGEVETERRLWPRFLTASVVIVLAFATATSISLLVEVTSLAKGISDAGLDGVRSRLTRVDASDPQTILILGSDKRPTDANGRSDTTVLMRLDPARHGVALFSLPRDLKVKIPNHGTNRLNAAYAIGGPSLTLRTVKRLTGLEINHLVNINFTGFADAVNAIDCVYIDVDRRYYHSNEGLPEHLQYAEIDIEAGYQRMCGFKALQYVRYRHTDNDLVRAARQQDFLREARQKITLGRLYDDWKELIEIVKRYTTSDIDSAETMIGILKLFIAAHDDQVQEIHFQGGIDPETGYVVASEKQIQAAVDQFLGIEDTPGARGDTPQAKQQPAGGRDRRGRPGRAGKKQRGARPTPAPAPQLELIDSTAVAEQLAEELAFFEDGEIRFWVQGPTRVLPGSTVDAEDSRAFRIDGPEDEIYRGYKYVISFFNPENGLTEYYGVSGTDWTDAPILGRPSEQRAIEGRTYDLFFDGDRLRLVAWRENGAAYWVTNTLLQTLSEQEVLAIANGVRRLARYSRGK